jgi:hypothetical protein
MAGHHDGHDILWLGRPTVDDAVGNRAHGADT